MFRSIFTKTMTIKYVIIKHQLIDWNRVGSRHFHVLVYIMPWHFWWLTLEGLFLYCCSGIALGQETKFLPKGYLKLV